MAKVSKSRRRATVSLTKLRLPAPKASAKAHRHERSQQIENAPAEEIDNSGDNSRFSLERFTFRSSWNVLAFLID